MIRIFSFLLLLITSSSLADVVKKIEILGNERISNNTILMFSDVSVGDDIKNVDTNNVLKKLYETNFFETVEIKLNQNILEINVTEFPIIQSVILDGIKSNKIQEKLLDNIIFKERSSYNEIYLNDEKNNLIKLLQDFGYYFSDIQILI